MTATTSVAAVMDTARIESLMVQALLPSWWEIKMEMPIVSFRRLRQPVAGKLLRMISTDAFSEIYVVIPFPDVDEEMVESALRADNSSVKGSRRLPKNPEGNASKTEKLKAFIKEEVVAGIYKDVFPCMAEKFFDLILSDDSNFTNEYRSARKDSNILIGKWHEVGEYDGQVREITFRSLCDSPMCPPDTAMTEYQHAVLSPDKKTLVFETVQLAHDVPFGSHFEVHCRWHLETIDENSCMIDVNVGIHFKKWCVMQSTIKVGAMNEYKKDMEVMLEVAHSFVKSNTSPKVTHKAAPSASAAESSY